MKIIHTWVIDEGNTAYELSGWPDLFEQLEFIAWSVEIGADPYVEVKSFYIAQGMGDVDYPAIQASVNTPEAIKTLLLLKWS